MTTQIDKQSKASSDNCANRANYPLINPYGQHTSNIDISKLSISQLHSIYASGYCIVTKRIDKAYAE